MKYLFLFALLASLMVGCSGEPEPTVGDAPIAKGIQRGEMPKPGQKASAAASVRRANMSLHDYAKSHQRK